MSANLVQGERREIAAADNHAALAALKAEGCNVLVDMTCVDYSKQGKSPRFDVIYRHMKLDLETGIDGGRLEVHCAVGEKHELRSVVDLWSCADWLKRKNKNKNKKKNTNQPNNKHQQQNKKNDSHPLR